MSALSALGLWADKADGQDISLERPCAFRFSPARPAEVGSDVKLPVQQAAKERLVPCFVHGSEFDPQVSRLAPLTTFHM